MIAPAILLVHRGEDGQHTNIPFTYRNGEMMALVEQVADVLIAMGAADWFWMAVASDRYKTIIDQRLHIAELEQRLQAYEELSPLREAAS